MYLLYNEGSTRPEAQGLGGYFANISSVHLSQLSVLHDRFKTTAPRMEIHMLEDPWLRVQVGSGMMGSVKPRLQAWVLEACDQHGA